jgi:transposase-like protein
MSDYRFNDAGPECPYCGHTETPDEPSYFRPELQDQECGDCGKTYEVEAEHSTTWRSWPKEAA